MKRALLKPEYTLNDIYEITPSMLRERGYKGMIFDLDNTVAPYEIPEPDDRMNGFFASLTENGIAFAFISNNKPPRLQRFTQKHGWFFVASAKKPFTYGIKRCVKHLGVDEKHILCVGDQLFTDCAAAHFANLDFCLVKPIHDRTDLFFRFKRAMEGLVTRHYGKGN